MSPIIKIAGAITLVLSVVAIVAESNHTSVAPAPPDHAYWLSLDRPVYLPAGAVICSEIDLMDAFVQGRQRGGVDEGHRAEQELFLHAGGDCIRTKDRGRVRVLDKTVPDDGLVKIEWSGLTNEEAFSRDLSN